MADFKTHITVSTALGIGYGAVAFRHFGVPAPTCILAGTLCSVSGMLPDLDSDSGVPLRESLAFAAACVPMLLLERFRHLGWSSETMALAGAGIYLSVRFGVGKLLKKFTVHRGMFHSIPAAVIAGEVAFLVCVSGDIYMRSYKACAVVAGFMSHLILDEIWSVKFAGGRFQLKSSSGTALKFWGTGWATIAAYAQMLFIGVIVLNDPIWSTFSPEGEKLHTIASRIYERFGRSAPAIMTSPLLPRGTGTTGRDQPPPTIQYAQQQPQQQYVAPQQQYATQPNANAQYDNSAYNNQGYAQPQYANPQYANPAPSGYVNNSAYSNPYGSQYSNSTAYSNSAPAPYSSSYPNNATPTYPAPAPYPQPSYPNSAPNQNYGTPSNSAYPNSVPYPSLPYPNAAANSQPPTYLPPPTSPQRY
jgi:hypothetical protein